MLLWFTVACMPFELCYGQFSLIYCFPHNFQSLAAFLFHFCPGLIGTDQVILEYSILPSTVMILIYLSYILAYYRINYFTFIQSNAMFFRIRHCLLQRGD